MLLYFVLERKRKTTHFALHINKHSSIISFFSSMEGFHFRSCDFTLVSICDHSWLTAIDKCCSCHFYGISVFIFFGMYSFSRNVKFQASCTLSVFPNLLFVSLSVLKPILRLKLILPLSYYRVCLIDMFLRIYCIWFDLVYS